MDVKDTLIRFAKPGVGSKFRFMSHIDVCDNSPRSNPRINGGRLMLTEETALRIVGNLRARGYRAEAIHTHSGEM
jgi:hypothetical protein